MRSFKLTFLRAYPLAIGVAAGIAWLLLSGGQVPEVFPRVFPEVVIVDSINIGFLSLAMSALASKESDDSIPVVVEMLRSGWWQEMMMMFVSAIAWNLIVAGASIVGLLALPQAGVAAFAVWVALAVTGFLATCRVMVVFVSFYRHRGA